jgi:hypothetical protein
VSEQGVRKSREEPSGWISSFRDLARSAVNSTWPRRSAAGIDLDRRVINNRTLRLSLHINLRVAMLCREVLKLVQEEAVCH